MRPLINLRWAVLAIIAVLVLAGPVAWGQDAETDDAQKLLKQGAAHYKDLDFKDAQATFLSIDRDRLSAEQAKQLDDYLFRVNGAVKQQASAMGAYEDGLEALKSNDLEKAGGLFENVAASEYVPEAVRKDARAQRALVIKRIENSKAAAAVKTETNAKPVTTQPTTKPTTKPVLNTPSDAAAQNRLKSIQADIDKAKTAIADGDKALDADQVDRAIAYFEQAVKIAPQYKPGHERLAFARSLVGTGGGLAAISRLERVRNIRKQETEVRYAEVMQRAREAMQAPKGIEDFERADNDVRYAQTLLATNKSLFTDTEYRAKNIEIEKLLEYIDLTRSKWQKMHVAEQIKEIEQTKRRSEMESNRRKAEKIASLKERAGTLRNEQKYKQAIEVYGEINKLDPNDDQAKDWLAQLDRFVQLLDAKEADRTGMREEVKQLNDIRWSQVPWHVLMNLPDDWPDKTLKRKPIGAGEVTESETDRAVFRRLNQNLAKLDFAGIDFKDVVQFLREVSNVSIHVKWAALEAVGIDQSTKVNVHLADVTLRKAIRTILEDVGGVNPLAFVVDEGVITISTKDDLSRQTVTRVYDIRDLIVSIPSFTGPAISLTTTSGGNNNTGSNGPFGGNNTTSGNNAGGNNESSRTELITSILDLIRSTIDPTSWRESSGEIGSISELGGQIVVTQTAENQRSLLDLLSKLRESRALQVNVEARFITVNSGFLNNVGIDLDFYFNLGSTLAPQPNAAGTAWAVDPITGARLTQAGPHLPQWTNGTWSNRMTPVPTGLGSYGFTNPAAGLSTGVGGDIGTAASGMSGLQMVGSFLDDIQVDFLVSATQAHAATRTLTAPRITLYNGQRAYVVVGQQVAYVASLEPVVGDNASVARPDVQTISTGTVLDVEATISADRRYVTMTVRPAVTVLNSIDTFPWGGGTSAGFVQLPNVSTQMLECTVSVPDGGTLLLGGQKTAGEVEREMGVPILSKIPVLNRITTNRASVRDDQTLLILVKPMIIIQREYEEAAFPP